MNTLILVHGTYRHPRDFNKIMPYINEHIGDNWWVDYVDWSPAHLTPAARRRGGQELARRIELAFQFNRAKKLAIVGHSHGGNVAFLSCRYLSRHHWPDFIGTIGTPMMGFYTDDYDRVSPGKDHYWGAWVSRADAIQWFGSVGRIGIGRRLDKNADYVKLYDQYGHKEMPYHPRVWDDIIEKINEVCK